MDLQKDTVRWISARKEEPEWLLEWRLQAYRHWLTMKEPAWANVHYPKINYQDIIYFAGAQEKNSTALMKRILNYSACLIVLVFHLKREVFSGLALQ
jgi:Fe-S cluster assembly protein SufB